MGPIDSQESDFKECSQEPDMNITWNPQDSEFLHGSTTVAPTAFYAGQQYYTNVQTELRYQNPDDSPMAYNPSYAPSTSVWQTNTATFVPVVQDQQITGGFSDLLNPPTVHRTTVELPSKGASKGAEAVGDSLKTGHGSKHQVASQSSGKTTGFRCPYCPNRVFTRTRDLQRHMHARHPKQESPVGNSSEFVDCQYCDKKNMRKDNLKRHIDKKHPNRRDAGKTHGGS